MRFHSFVLTVVLCGTLIAPASLAAEPSRLLGAAQFQQRTEQGTFTLLDVRTPKEYATGHLAGAMLLNYLDSVDFKRGLERLPKNTVYLVYCRSGHRSRPAVEQMKEAGFRQVYEMKGGINAWRAEHLPVHEPAVASK